MPFSRTAKESVFFWQRRPRTSLSSFRHTALRFFFLYSFPFFRNLFSHRNHALAGPQVGSRSAAGQGRRFPPRRQAGERADERAGREASRKRQLLATIGLARGEKPKNSRRKKNVGCFSRSRRDSSRGQLFAFSLSLCFDCRKKSKRVQSKVSRRASNRGEGTRERV